MTLAEEPFEKIASGKKVIESRLYDEKRRNITIGDEIEFVNHSQPEQKILTRVADLLRSKSFKKLFADHDASLFGGESKESLLHEIRKFYSNKNEQKYGVVGISIKVIDRDIQ